MSRGALCNFQDCPPKKRLLLACPFLSHCLDVTVCLKPELASWTMQQMPHAEDNGKMMEGLCIPAPQDPGLALNIYPGLLYVNEK